MRPILMNVLKIAIGKFASLVSAGSCLIVEDGILNEPSLEDKYGG
jgi:cephalosporin hydroxylase